jgi:outer membrane protein assembly factor BamB
MQFRMTRRQVVALPFGFAASAAVAALAQGEGNAAWPQFRGPDRNGVSRETGLLKAWPAEGPALVWKATDLGGTNSAPSVAGGSVFGMSYRGADEFVWALEEATGKPLWSARIAPANYNIGRQAQDGPGCTPTVVGERLYALGMSGDLVCMQVSDGKLLWQKNLVRDFGGAVPRWGFAESPLVDGEKLIVTPGGAQATLVALNPASGEVIWKSPIGDGAHYSSAIIAEVGEAPIHPVRVRWGRRRGGGGREAAVALQLAREPDRQLQRADLPRWPRLRRLRL